MALMFYLIPNTYVVHDRNYGIFSMSNLSAYRAKSEKCVYVLCLNSRHTDWNHEIFILLTKRVYLFTEGNMGISTPIVSGLGHMTRNRECSFQYESFIWLYRGFAIAKGVVCMHVVSAFKEFDWNHGISSIQKKQACTMQLIELSKCTHVCIICDNISMKGT